MISKKAYTEVNEVISNLPKELQEKIPQDLMNSIRANMDLDYEFNIEDFENGYVLGDTKKILSVIYTDYLSTEEERKVILAKESILKNNK